MKRVLLLTCPTFDPLLSALYLNGWLLKTEDLNYNDPAIESLFQSFQELPHTETRSAISALLLTTAPPSPSAPRFLVG